MDQTDILQCIASDIFHLWRNYSTLVETEWNWTTTEFIEQAMHVFLRWVSL